MGSGERESITVSGIATGLYNPFRATGEELLAAALEEAGLLRDETLFDGTSAREFLQSYFRKRSHYQEVSRLGALLVRRGILQEEELQRALSHQAGGGMKLGEALVELGICSVDDIESNLDAQTQIREGFRDIEEFRKKIDSIKGRLRLYF